MKTLEQIKNDFAVSKNFTDWDDLVYDLGYNSPSRLLLIIDQVMKIYAMECLKLTSENAEVDCFHGTAWLETESITNENNIIK